MKHCRVSWAVCIDVNARGFLSTTCWRWTLLLWVAMPWAAQAAQLQLLEEGFTASAYSQNCSGGMDFVPGGDLACSDGTRVVVFDSNGDGTPQTPRALFQFPTGTVFGSFVKTSPSGKILLIGESSAGQIYEVEIATGVKNTIATLPLNFGAAFLSNEEVILSASPTGNATTLYRLHLPTRMLQAIAELSGPSGPVTLDDAKNLYYIRSTFEFPAPPASHALLLFSSAKLVAALRNNQLLGESDATVLATLDSGFGLLLNSFGDGFVSDLTGSIRRVTPAGATSLFAQVTGGFGLVTTAAFDQTHRPFQPYEPSGSRAAFMLDDFSQTQQVVIVEPQRDDPFGDAVINYAPGPGQFVNNPNFNNPQRALGAPLGGGTVSGNMSSVVTLGDGGTLTLKTFAPIVDDPRNRYGLDLIAFGNAFLANNNPLIRWAEPAFMEVSQDLNHNGLPDDAWLLILPDPLPSVLSQMGPVQYRTLALRHYADATPTLQLGDMNGDNDTNDPGDQPTISPALFYTIPDRAPSIGDASSFAIDQGSGGGDGFDLREAVVQTAPGVPWRDSTGQVRRLYLDRVNFVRLTDAVVGDAMAPTGEVSAEIDAIADTRAQLQGRQIHVDAGFVGSGNGSPAAPYRDLHTAMSQAVSGDEVVVRAGVYRLTQPLIVTPGVSLVGSAGLWTPNVSEDDTVIDASTIQYAPGEVEAALVARSSPTATPIEGQIAGFHMSSCRTGLLVEGRALTIQENMLTDCFIGMDIRNGPGTIVVRRNIIGHQQQGQPETGLRCEARTIALIHNVFAHHDQEAVLTDYGCQVYLRDNIFFANRRPIRQIGDKSFFGHFNVFFAHTAPPPPLHGIMEQEILQDPAFAFPETGDYRLRVSSAVRGQGMGGADPGVYEGSLFIPFSVVLDTLPPAPPTGLTGQRSGNVVTMTWISSVEQDAAGYRLYRSETLDEDFGAIGGVIPSDTTTYLDSGRDPGKTFYYAITTIDRSGNESVRSVPIAVGPTAPFILSLDVSPLINVQPAHLSGAVSAKMILDYLGSGQSVSTLQAAGVAANSSEHAGALFLDPQGLRGVLNRFHPPKYNFEALSQVTAEQLLRDISYWVSFSVQGATPTHVPGVFPAFGDYQHWMLVTGIATSENPQQSREYSVLGMWLHDPNRQGIGARSFKTAEELKQTYLLPVKHQDRYQGRYVSILEPPARDAIVHLARCKTRLCHFDIRPTLTHDAIDATQLPSDQRRMVQRAALAALREELGVHDKRVQQLCETLKAHTPLVIHDAQEPYYLVPFGNGRHAQAAVILSAQDGRFKEASWSETAQPYLPISRREAVAAVKARLQQSGYLRTARSGHQWRARNIEVRLVHRPGTSPYHPTWNVRVFGMLFRVDQQGTVRGPLRRPSRSRR